jgi:hypothetical protein
MGVYAADMDERTLRRIIATLVALALLAERAAGRSWPVRRLVLWMLRRAEFAVGDYVFAVTGTPPSAFAGIAEDESGPEEAFRLAASFRMLAAVLGAVLSIALRRALPAGPVAPCGRPLDLRTPKPNDTS